MSCRPWQSVHAAATLLPLLRARPCTVALYSLTSLGVAVAAGDGLELVGVRQFLGGDVGVAIGALEVHLAVHRLGEDRCLHRDRAAVATFGVLVAMAGEARLVVSRRGRACAPRDSRHQQPDAKGRGKHSDTPDPIGRGWTTPRFAVTHWEARDRSAAGPGSRSSGTACDNPRRRTRRRADRRDP